MARLPCCVATQWQRRMPPGGTSVQRASPPRLERVFLLGVLQECSSHQLHVKLHVLLRLLSLKRPSSSSTSSRARARLQQFTDVGREVIVRLCALLPPAREELHDPHAACAAHKDAAQPGGPR